MVFLQALANCLYNLLFFLKFKNKKYRIYFYSKITVEFFLLQYCSDMV